MLTPKIRPSLGYPPKWEKPCPRCGRTAMQNFTAIGAAEKSVAVHRKRQFVENRSDDGMLELRGEFTSCKTKIDDASDDWWHEVAAVLDKWCRKSIQTGLLVATVINELEYLSYSGRMNDVEIWRCCWRSRIVRRMSRIGWELSEKAEAAKFCLWKRLRTDLPEQKWIQTKGVCSPIYGGECCTYLWCSTCAGDCLLIKTWPWKSNSLLGCKDKLVLWSLLKTE